MATIHCRYELDQHDAPDLSDGYVWLVACTRARDHLYLSYSSTPSPFLSIGR